jgi:lipopolysaccharide transport system ATP-binding protein
MTEPVIRVENVGKRYRIRHQRTERYVALRDVLARKLTAPVRWLRSALAGNGAARPGPVTYEDFWAIKDLSFEMRQGETIGIIGRNGAGKSTLLKILSRITEPTCGRIRIRGRVASLLEVGTGFHPELTGRENIFLNGAILGMTRAEMRRKFDEIVAFAGIEKFLDTPVKRFSSGMYVRLAFGIAAHIEPEILIVDEVLAVGDAEFQKKCLDKMETVGTSGRTVIFVSHNMQAVTRLCRRAILLDQGTLKKDGPAHEVASAYMNPQHGSLGAREWPKRALAPGDDVTRLRAVRIRSGEGEIISSTDIRQPVAVEIEFEVLKAGYIFHPHFGLWNEEGLLIFVANDVDPKWQGRKRPPGRYIATGRIPGNFLAEGALSVAVSLMTLDPEHSHTDVMDSVMFHVVDPLSAKDTARGEYPRPMPGVLRPKLEWTNHYEPLADDLVSPAVQEKAV